MRWRRRPAFMDYPGNEWEKDQKTNKENQLEKQKILRSKGISEFAKEEKTHGLTKNFDNPEGLSNQWAHAKMLTWWQTKPLAMSPSSRDWKQFLKQVSKAIKDHDAWSRGYTSRKSMILVMARTVKQEDARDEDRWWRKQRRMHRQSCCTDSAVQKLCSGIPKGVGEDFSLMTRP